MLKRKVLYMYYYDEKLYFKMTVFSCQNVFKVKCVHYPINEYLTNNEYFLTNPTTECVTV